MTNDIHKKIPIDIEFNPDGQQQIAQYKIAFDDLRNSINTLGKPLADLSNSISALDKDISNFSNSGNNAKNKISDLVSSFSTWGNVIKIVKEAISGWEIALTGGLAIITTYAPEIIKWVSSLFKGKEAIDKVKMSLDALNEGLSSSEFENVIENLNTLKINVELARKGLVNKTEVVKQYNNTLGKTIGQVKSLDEVESSLKNNSREYIKAMVNKATALAAIKDASEKQIEAQKELNKSDAESIDYLNSGFANSTDKGVQKMYHEIAERNRRAAAKPLLDYANRKMEIASESMKQSDEAINKLQEANDPIKKIKKQIDGLKKITDSNIVGSKTFTQIKQLQKELSNLQKSAEGSNSNKPNNTFKESLTEAEQIRKDSLTRQLQITYEAYGAETLAEDNRHKDELAKLNKLRQNKQISQAEYNKVTQQLEAEHHTNLSAIIDKFNQQDAEKVQQASNELAELKIKGMKAGADKEIAELTQQQQEREQLYDKEEAENTKRLKALYAEIDAAKEADPNADVSVLQSQLDNEWKIIAVNNQKRVQDEQQTADAIKKIRDQAAQDTEAKAAQQREEEAKKQAEIKTAKDKVTSEQAEKKKKDAQDLKNFEIQIAQEVSSAAFSLINNSIKAQSDAKIKQLEASKNSELKNTTLTAAQKQAIQNSYQKKENAVKVKAFKDEQLASLAQAVINGALAVTKVTSQTGAFAAFAIPLVIAETAIQVATIAAQKPPAYAKGGLHYSSDGRGGLLPGYSRTDNTNAYLRSGEGIIVSEAMQVPWARNLVSAINVGFGGRDFSVTNPGRGYAVGGIFTDGGNANRYYNQPVHDQKNLANTIAYQMINNFPPVYVDVKDINNQQNILAQTINRVNL